MKLADLPNDKKIILFDGTCNLCDSSVKFIIKHDRKDVFRFAALQSAIGEEILHHLGENSKKMDSLVLFEPGKGHYYKSEAVIRIAKGLGRFYSLLSVFSTLPKSVTDLVYDFVAANRYKWFGRKTTCMIPTAEIKAKFLD